MAERVVCSMCEKGEKECKCDRYCIHCKAVYNIRLCMDGLYYCPDCREACQISVVGIGTD